jgi:Flp pilus assembly protein TadD
LRAGVDEQHGLFLLKPSGSSYFKKSLGLIFYCHPIVFPFPAGHAMSLFAHRRAKIRLCLLMPLAMMSLAGCTSVSGFSPLGEQISASLPNDETGLRRYAEELGRRYDANPADRQTVLIYAAVLRKLGQTAQAVALLQREAASNPEDLDVLGAYGKALADVGRYQEAAEVLSRAHTPERPNWSILSAQGSVADRLGDHAQAQGFYEAALKIIPDEASVLSNLGLSYALSRDLERAEETSRRATQLPQADMRVRQNYALILALRGKFSEAEEIARRDLRPEEAAQNIAEIRASIAQSDTWKALRQAQKDNTPRVILSTIPRRPTSATKTPPALRKGL